MLNFGLSFIIYGIMLSTEMTDELAHYNLTSFVLQ